MRLIDADAIPWSMAYHEHFMTATGDDEKCAWKRNIDAMPTIERKKGTWIWDDEGYHCSECFFHAYGNTLECLDGTYCYCPNCGADMRG